MAYRLKNARSISDELSRVVAKEFDQAASELRGAKGSSRADAIHEARKHVKKIRAVLRMLQEDLDGDYDSENQRLRDLAHQLSALRDVDAAAETLQSLHQHYPHLVSNPVAAPVRAGLRARKRSTAAAVDPESVLKRATRQLRQSAGKVSTDVARAGGHSAMSAGMTRGYRRARKALDAVRRTPDDAVFHAWRRRLKDHWYQVRLLEGLSQAARRRAQALKRLETWLGDDHNLVLLRGTILDRPESFGDEKTTAVVLGCAAKYQASLRRRAVKAGERAFARKPRAFRKTVDRWLT